ncbi:MAG: sigma-70 family RNA polymerase sigma factor [Bacillota bacterium]|nr:sigma-70 family RNA polymerase sigma factor [Bacillota bacterium]
MVQSAQSDSRYKSCSDSALTTLIKSGDNVAFNELTARYIYLIRKKTSDFHVEGFESDDLMQEGLMGLLSAAKSYDPNSPTKFSTYAAVCIERRLLTVCRGAQRQKHIPLNRSLSLNDSIVIDTIDLSSDPMEKILINEATEDLLQRVKKTFSVMESKVFSDYLSGLSYSEIAKKLAVSEKSVDNALQRIRKKLKN